ncbi:hypothetical protein TNCT_531671 [Trichonephila clavata]|uniref:Uncharacterized protein n=1 Tax=Trichonephila clavata TaxID=2740835 RepID=A0A8X6KQB2_TRICU|nr:hypothetical protein TNCT_531671 [Trichonephila clavata]
MSSQSDSVFPDARADCHPIDLPFFLPFSLGIDSGAYTSHFCSGIVCSSGVGQKEGKGGIRLRRGRPAPVARIKESP